MRRLRHLLSGKTHRIPPSLSARRHHALCALPERVRWGAAVTAARGRPSRCREQPPKHAPRARLASSVVIQKTFVAPSPPPTPEASDSGAGGGDGGKGRGEGEEEAKKTGKQHVVNNRYNRVEVIRCEDHDALLKAFQGRAGELPHVCVAGVSNAGKSSLINHLILKKNMAKASSVAGKTKTIDLFLINDKFVIADFPGMPSTDLQTEGMWKGKWRPLVKSYMTHVPDLRGFLYIHDIRWPVAPDEVKFTRWMRERFTIQSFLLVLSKNDKVDHNRRRMGLNNARNKLDWRDDQRHIHYCSNNTDAKCRASRRHVLRYIESALNLGRSKPGAGVVCRPEELDDPV